MLIEAYKKCLAVLMQCHGGFTDGEQPITLSICGHSVETIRYCVSQEKVSIHLPVSRLLAGKAYPPKLSFKLLIVINIYITYCVQFYMHLSAFADSIITWAQEVGVIIFIKLTSQMQD